MCVLVCAGLSGCQTLGIRSAEKSPIHLFLRLEKTTLRPGEALVGEVFAANMSGKAIKAGVPNYKTLTFWIRDDSGLPPVRLAPVYSEKEAPMTVQELAPDDFWPRKFVFTRAAEPSGTFTLVAAYESDPERALPVCYVASSRAATFVVEGERAMERDRNGILLKTEAMRIAREHLGQPVKEIDARLIINEAGFYDWFVLLTLQEKEVKKALLVNPYLGQVRRAIDPALFPREAEPPVPRIFMKSNE